MKPENRGKRDLSLQILALYLFFVVPIFVLTLIFYQTASKRLEADIAAADLSLARAIALETDAMLVKARDAVAAFAQDPAVIQADPIGMEQAFKAGAVARQDINLFYRLSAEGIMLYHYPSGPTSTVGDDFSFRGYFQAALKTHEHTFSKGRISPTTSRPVVTSVMPVMVNGKFDGVVATNLELQRLTETLNRIVSKYQDRQAVKIIIVDATGQIIAHSEPEKLLDQDSMPLPGVDEVLVKREGSLQDRDADGQEWLYTYTPVPIANWGVIVQRSSRQAFASSETLRNGMVLALVVFALGALFFWLALSRRFIVPLEKLTEYGQQVGRENYQGVVSTDDLTAISLRQDQIGLLTRSILRAEHHIRQRLMELTTLHKTSAAVVSTLDTHQVIDRILTEVQRLLSVHQCALLVIDETDNRLEIKASRGLSRSYPTKINLTENPLDLPAGEAIATGRAVQIQDIESGLKTSLLVSIARAEGYRSLLVVPLKAPHIPMAALSIYRTDVHEFTGQEIDLATSFANFAAIALEHATLFNLTDAELQKRVRFLSALHRVGLTVSQSLVVDDVLDNAMEAVFEVMPAVACWIYLQPQTENHLRLRAHRGFSEEFTDYLRTQTIYYGQGIVGQVAQNGQSIFLDEDQLRQKPWSEDSLVTAGDWRSFGVAPLLAKETVIGVLGMAARTEKAFSPAEVELLEAIGNQIAIAVVNARLYRRSREAATLEERNRVAREIHDTLAQGFTGILIQLQAAERLSRKHPEKAIHSLQVARDLARQSLQEARRSVLNLRPAVLENMTLDQAIAQIADQFQTNSGIATRFMLEGYPFTLDPGVKQNLYRITQEALTNVSRYAQASRVDIVLIYDAQMIELDIRDNGVGMTGVYAETNGRNGGSSSENSDEGFGLIGIRERVNLMKGQVWFNSPPAGGVQVKVVIPK